MSVSVKLKKDQLKYLGMLAKKRGKTIDYYISKAIDKYLETLEDKYFAKLADKRLADIRSGKSKTIPHEEVMKRNGLSD